MLRNGFKRLLVGFLTAAMVMSSAGMTAAFADTDAETSFNEDSASVSGDSAYVAGDNTSVSGDKASVSGDSTSVSGDSVSGDKTSVSGDVVVEARSGDEPEILGVGDVYRARVGTDTHGPGVIHAYFEFTKISESPLLFDLRVTYSNVSEDPRLTRYGATLFDLYNPEDEDDINTIYGAKIELNGSDTGARVSSFLPKVKNVTYIDSHIKGLGGNDCVLPNGLFNGNVYLQSVVIGDGSKTGIKTIDSSCFFGCTNLKNVIICDGVEKIKDNAFQNCTNLEYVYFPKTVYTVNQQAFRDCVYLKGACFWGSTTPETALTIGASCFEGCRNMEYLTLPKYINLFGENCLKGAHIENEAYKLRIYYPPGGYTYNGEFYSNNVGIYSADTGVDKKGTWFKQTNITSGKKGYIGNGPGENLTFELDCGYSGGVLIFTGSSKMLDFYDRSLYPWAPDTVSGIEGKPKSIGRYAFYGKTTLKKAELSCSSRQTIGEKAFWGCTELKTLTLYGKAVINKEGFSGCTSLETVTINSGAESIAEKAFSGCRSLTELSFSAEDLASNAFENCVGLETLTYYGGVIHENAFSGCSLLRAVNLQDSYSPNKADVKAGAFNGCSSLKNLALGNQTEFELPITDSPNSLESVSVQSGHEKYAASKDKSYIWSKTGNTLVMGTKKATVIEDGIATIGENAFNGVSALTATTFPYSLTKVEKNAFNGCTGLGTKSIKYLGSETEWDSRLKPNIVSTGNSAITNTSKYEWVLSNGDFTGGGSWEIEDKDVDGVTKKTLTITGITELPDYNSLAEVPWHESEARIQRVEASGVTAVGGYCFDGAYDLEAVEFDTLTAVGGYAFCGCEKLPAVPGMATLTTIGAHAFESCSFTGDLTLSAAETIGDHAFDNCGELDNKADLGAAKTIGEYAFNDCVKLKEIDISAATEKIGTGVLSGCIGLQKIVVDAGNTKYSGNTENSVLIENDTKTIIAVCPTKMSINLSDTDLTTIADGVFANNTNITTVTLPDTLTTIGDKAFSGCTGLTAIVIPENVTSIGSHAFEGCDSVTAVTIPAKVETIGEAPFEGCTALATITVAEGNQKFSGENKTLVDKTTHTLLAGCKESTGIPAGVTAIGEGAFKGLSTLTAIKAIPDGVTSIGADAFNGCVSLTEMALPKSLKTIGSFAFYDCRKITGKMVLSGVTSLGESAFEKCALISEAVIPGISNASNLGAAVFRDDRSLEKITINKGVSVITDNMFMGCIKLDNVEIPEGVKTIGEAAFSGNSVLKILTIPYSLRTVGVNAFNGTALTSVTYTGTPESFERIAIESGNYELKIATFTYLDPPPEPEDPESTDSGETDNGEDTPPAPKPEKKEEYVSTVSNNYVVTDSSGNELKIDMVIEFTDRVSYNGLKHVPAGSKAGGGASADLTVNVTGSLLDYVDIKKITVKNNKLVSEGSSKKPEIIINIKPKTKDKAAKKALSDIGKKLKKEPFTFEIVPLDLGTVRDSLQAKANGKKTKVSKLTFTTSTGSGSKTVKLSKKDFTVESIEESVATITGKGNLKGTVKLGL